MDYFQVCKKSWEFVSIAKLKDDPKTIMVGKVGMAGGSAKHKGSIRASLPAGLGSILSVPKIFSISELLDVNEI